MLINTTRFGEIEISEDSILQMPWGMLGFESCKRYVLLQDQPETPYKWLQAVDDPALAFIVINPLDFFPDYDIDLPEEDAESIGLRDPADAALMTTVTVDKKEGRVTTNLLGPIVINSDNLHAKQVVLQDERYGTKHMVAEKASINTDLGVAANAA